MSLGDRIQSIISEQNIKQVEFAKELGISSNYVNLLANNKKQNISEPLAKLIEETYGYSKNWILNGSGNKFSQTKGSLSKNDIIKKVGKMNDTEVMATLTFVLTLESVNKTELDRVKKAEQRSS